MPVPAIPKRRHAELAGQALKFVAELAQIEPLSPDFEHKLEAIEALGRDTVTALGARHAGSLAHVAPPPTTGIARAIAALRGLAESLEPLRPGNLGEAPRRFGLLHGRADPKAYFARYRAAGGEIEATLSALTRERDALIRANVALETEGAALIAPLTALAEHMLFAEELALTLTARADTLAARDPVRARRLTGEALGVVQSRLRDLAEARALAAQALAVREVIKATNLRLIEGIEQASATMLLVLKTAIEAARLIAQQELVLGGIASLNRAASNLITAETAPEAEASSAALQSAFARLHDALDRLDSERAGSAARLTTG